MRAIVGQEYPRFSDAEYERRHRALARLMQEKDLDHLLVVTDHRSGNAPQWLTGWPAYDPAVATRLGLGEHERVLGFLHLGTAREAAPERERPDPMSLLTELSP